MSIIISRIWIWTINIYDQLLKKQKDNCKTFSRTQRKENMDYWFTVQSEHVEITFGGREGDKVP